MKKTVKSFGIVSEFDAFPRIVMFYSNLISDMYPIDSTHYQKNIYRNDLTTFFTKNERRVRNIVHL